MKAMLFGPTLTGVSGLFNIALSFSLSMYALSMVQYAGIIFSGIIPHTKIIAIVILTVFFLSTIKGSKFVAMISNVMTVVLLVAISLFVIMGLPKVQSGYLEAEDFFMNGGAGFIQAISINGIP